MRRSFVIAAVSVLLAISWTVPASRAVNAAQSQSFALQLKEISAEKAAQIVRTVYPSVRINVDPGANALIVTANGDTADQVKQLLATIDAHDPRRPTADVVHLRTANAVAVGVRMSHLYPSARFTAGPNNTLLILASPDDIDQIKALASDIDITPASKDATVPVRILQANAKDVARMVEREVHVHADVAGSEIFFTGPGDAPTRARDLAATLDVPPAGTKYLQVYHLGFAEAASTAALLARSFPHAVVAADPTLNTIAVTAAASDQARVAGAIAQIDAAPGPTISQPGTSESTTGPSGTAIAVVNLRDAVPGVNGTLSTSASDIATTVEQALGSSANDLHITIEPNSTRLVLSGSALSVKLAKQLIEELDQAQDLVVLDTQIFEIDTTSAKELGLTAGTPGSPFLSTTLTEYPPQPGPTALPGASPPPFFGIQPITRTPLTLNVALYALIQNGNARILADPRITTISGRTASIRAGDNISVLTTTPGGVGVPPTQQIQTFQTGVTLDITPVINEGNFITVHLHPTVNSLSSVNAEGIPQISTRDTQTTVGMRADQTLVIGGLIEDTSTESDQRIPVLSSIPVVGGLFKQTSRDRHRNELVIAVTPHIIHPGEQSPLDRQGPALPSPQPLPTTPSNLLFPVPMSSGEIYVPARKPTSVTTVSTSGGISRPTTQQIGVPSPQSSERPVFTRPDPTPTPLQLSTVQGPAGTYTYGTPTANIQAGPNDAASIYYMTFSPNLVSNGTAVTFSATTSTNVTRLLLLNGNNSIATLTNPSPGHWNAQFNFSTAGLNPTATQLTLTVAAFKQDGTSITVQFPIGIKPCGTGPPQAGIGAGAYATPQPC